MSRIRNTGRYSVDERKRKEGAKAARSVPHLRLKILIVVKAEKATEVRSFTERIGGSNTRRERPAKRTKQEKPFSFKKRTTDVLNPNSLASFIYSVDMKNSNLIQI
jgi:hypothetical protein